MHITINGKRIEIICTTCHIQQPAADYRIAMTTTRVHNAELHPHP